MLLDAALAYARHGIPVLPVHTPAADGSCSCGRPDCDRPGKHPRLRHGLTDASTDPRRIDLWWSRWPEANVGLRTGLVMDVADVDSPTGAHGLRHLLGGELPAGPQVHTGGGGWHFWFLPLGYGNRVRLLPGVDWRGAGGYVVAPPSRHASGATYDWVVRPGADPPPEGPAALRDLIAGPDPPWSNGGPADFERSAEAGPGRPGPGEAIARPEAGPARSGPGEAIARPGAGPARSGRGGAIARPGRYAAVALEAEADRVARAPVGARNDTLNRAAFALGRLVGAGLLDPGVVVYELTVAARWAGLGRDETVRTIGSGLTAGRRQPYQPFSRGRDVA